MKGKAPRRTENDSGTTRSEYDFRGAVRGVAAARYVLEGTVIGTCMRQHRHQEWLKFLNLAAHNTRPSV